MSGFQWRISGSNLGFKFAGSKWFKTACLSVLSNHEFKNLKYYTYHGIFDTQVLSILMHVGMECSTTKVLLQIIEIPYAKMYFSPMC